MTIHEFQRTHLNNSSFSTLIAWSWKATCCQEFPSVKVVSMFLPLLWCGRLCSQSQSPMMQQQSVLHHKIAFYHLHSFALKLMSPETFSFSSFVYYWLIILGTTIMEAEAVREVQDICKQFPVHYDLILQAHQLLVCNNQQESLLCWTYCSMIWWFIQHQWNYRLKTLAYFAVYGYMNSKPLQSLRSA